MQEIKQSYGRYCERIQRVSLVGADPHPLDSVRIDGILCDDKQRMLDILTKSISYVDENAINRTSRVGTL